jgi:hypothetical protein
MEGAVVLSFFKRFMESKRKKEIAIAFVDYHPIGGKTIRRS